MISGFHLLCADVANDNTLSDPARSLPSTHSLLPTHLSCAFACAALHCPCSEIAFVDSSSLEPTRLVSFTTFSHAVVVNCGSDDLTSICLQMLVGNSASHSGHNRAWPQPPAPCSSHLELHAISLPLLRLLMHMLVRFRTVLRHSSSHANTTFFFLFV